MTEGLSMRNPNEGKKKYSIVHWQTGEPKESGLYLVTIKGMYETFVTYSRYSCLNGWPHFNKVLAWCLLGSIKPYKEESL